MKQILGSVGAAICRPGLEVILSPLGHTVNEAIQNIPQIYSSVCVDKYVIMPNHMHLIPTLQDSKRQIAAPTNLHDVIQPVATPTVHQIIGGMKRAVSIKLGNSIWQKSFHDRIIRNNTEYKKIWQYIDTNPAKWKEDRYYADDSISNA